MWLFGNPFDQKAQHDCDWIRYGRIQTRYSHRHAAVRKVHTEWILEPVQEGTCLKVRIQLDCNNPLVALYLKGYLSTKGRSAINDILKKAESEEGHLVGCEKNLSKKASKLIDQGTEKLLEKGCKRSWVLALIRELKQAPDSDLATMRPYALADKHVLARPSMLSLLSSAAKAGLLERDWLATCTACQRWSKRLHSLSELTNKVLCSRCGESFSVALDNNVEIIFRPTPSIHKIDLTSENPLNPRWNPEVLVRQTLKPNGVMVLGTQLLPGSYAVHSHNADPDSWAHFTVKEKGPGEISCEIAESGFDVIQKPHRSESKLRLTNRTKDNELFVLEETVWRKQRCPALAALCCQAFREAFPDEHPPAEHPFPIKDLTILVSDIAGSSAICKNLGDHEAFLQFAKILQEQANVIGQHEGSVAKVSGDAIFACFPRPELALQAALTIRSQVALYLSLSQGAIETELKMGIHKGPCLAVNLANLFDIFGATVCATSGLMNICQPGQLLATEAVMSEKSVQELIDVTKCETRQMEEILPGNDEKSIVTEIIPTESEEQALAGIAATGEKDFFVDISFEDEKESKDSDSGTLYV